MSNIKSTCNAWPYPRHSRFERMLRKAARRWFESHDYDTHARKPYMLARFDLWRQNIILDEVSEYIQGESEKNREQGTCYPLHKYLHHGLSSQAMLFNLVGPLIVRKDLEPLRDIFTESGIMWPGNNCRAEFEYDDRNMFNEVTGQPTSIDLVINDASGRPRIFIEGKLVERDFGSCSLYTSGDCNGMNPAKDPTRCYLDFIGRTYWKLMKRHGLLAGPILSDSTCIMANHYQFFRELLFSMQNGGSFVLFCDGRSPTFWLKKDDVEMGLMPLLLRLLPADVRGRVAIVTIAQVIRAIRQTARHDDWVAEFERKYGLDD